MSIRSFIGFEGTVELALVVILLSNIAQNMTVSFPMGGSISFGGASTELPLVVLITLIIICLAFIASIFAVSVNVYQSYIRINNSS